MTFGEKIEMEEVTNNANLNNFGNGIFEQVYQNRLKHSSKKNYIKK